MTRYPHRDRDTIAWSTSVLTAYSIVAGVIADAAITDPVRWVPWAFFAGCGWLIVAVVCCVLIEEAVRRQRRVRRTVPDEQMRYGRPPAVTRARRDIPFDEYLDDPLAATDEPVGNVDEYASFLAEMHRASEVAA